MITSLTNETKAFQYIGVRSSNCNPFEDEYMGSSDYLGQDIEFFGRDNFHKQILCVADNRELAEQIEQQLLRGHWNKRPDTYNKGPGESPTYSQKMLKYMGDPSIRRDF